jgi:hypothetical protein
MSRAEDTFTRALERRRKQFERELKRRLTASAIVVQAKAMEYTPLDLGNLQNSQYREAVINNSITIGYTADYAAALHNRDFKPQPVGTTVWTKEGNRQKVAANMSAKPQFLADALEEKRPEVMRILSGAIQL